MPNEISELPYKIRDMESKEYFESLHNVAKTTDARRNALSDLYFSGIFPDDLKDYAQFLIHDAGNSSCNLDFYAREKSRDHTTWRSMYQCLQWIQHIDVLIELVDLRTNR